MSTTTTDTIGSWQPDPWHRHELRWQDGEVWTDAVIDGGEEGRDSEIASPVTARAMAGPTLPPVAPAARPPTPASPSPGVLLDEPLNSAVVPTTRPHRRERHAGRAFVRAVVVFVVGVAVGVIVAPTVREWWDERSSSEVTNDAAVPMLLGPDATHAEEFIEAATFGEDWPLTVDAGTVVCEVLPSPAGAAHVFFVSADRNVYAVNGVAAAGIEQHGWRALEEIWRTDPSVPGARMDITPVRERGQAICEPAASAATDASAADAVADP